MKLSQGFSLIEIMVVLVIMGLLAAIAAPELMNVLDNSKKRRIYADFANIKTALKVYRLENFNYPTTDQGLDVLVSQTMETLPRDPWNRPYLYESPSSEGHPYLIYTLGADGQRGGEKENQDLTNWDKMP